MFSHTKIVWDTTATTNPRISQILTTGPSGLTKATVLGYSPNYNNVEVKSECVFTADGTAGTVLRTTKTEYETSSNYIDRHLLHLPTSVKVYAGTSTSASARVD